MAIVFFLERLVMTVHEGPITNDHFLACTSVSIITAWRTTALWDWATFLDKTCDDTAAHLTLVFLNEEK